jgi:hypothetical protein
MYQPGAPDLVLKLPCNNIHVFRTPYHLANLQRRSHAGNAKISDTHQTRIKEVVMCRG